MTENELQLARGEIDANLHEIRVILAGLLEYADRMVEQEGGGGDD